MESSKSSQPSEEFRPFHRLPLSDIFVRISRRLSDSMRLFTAPGIGQVTDKDRLQALDTKAGSGGGPDTLSRVIQPAHRLPWRLYPVHPHAILRHDSPARNPIAMKETAASIAANAHRLAPTMVAVTARRKAAGPFSIIPQPPKYPALSSIRLAIVGFVSQACSYADDGRAASQGKPGEGMPVMPCAA
jgi:hypothetical protein